MSAVGSFATEPSAPGPTDVRSYSNSDQNDAARRMTRSANSCREQSQQTALLFDHLVGAQQE